MASLLSLLLTIATAWRDPFYSQAQRIRDALGLYAPCLGNLKNQNVFLEQVRHARTQAKKFLFLHRTS